MLFYQPNSGYIYNSDTIFLYDFISSFNPRGKLLDIGSGSGVLGLLLARDHNITLTQCEIQERYVFLSAHNAKINKIDSFMKDGNFLDLIFEEKYDYIVSNPPFYHDNVIKSIDESLRISRYADNLPIEDFFKKVNSLLNPKGVFAFCYDAKQISELIVNLAKYKMIIEDIKYVHPKKDKEANIVMIKTRKGSRALTKTHPPMIVFDGEEFTQEAQEIYSKAQTYTLKCEI